MSRFDYSQFDLPERAPLLQDLGQHIAEWYAIRRTFYESPNPESVRQFGDEMLWYRVAEQLVDHVIAPNMFIDAQFAGRAWPRRPVSPARLLSREAIDRYAAHREKKFDETVALLRIDLNTSKSRARQTVCIGRTAGDSYRDAVLSAIYEPSSATPLFRFLLAFSEEGFVSAANDCYAFAVLEYVPLRREYDAAWASIIPPDFAANAEKSYVQMCSPVAAP